MTDKFADIIIPVAVPGLFTYGIPGEIRGSVHRGSLVTVTFGQTRDATGLVTRIHDTRS